MFRHHRRQSDVRVRQRRRSLRCHAFRHLLGGGDRLGQECHKPEDRMAQPACLTFDEQWCRHPHFLFLDLKYAFSAGT